MLKNEGDLLCGLSYVWFDQQAGYVCGSPIRDRGFDSKVSDVSNALESSGLAALRLLLISSSNSPGSR